MKAWVRDTILGAAVVLAIVGAAYSFYYSRLAAISVAPKQALTTDQILASLSTETTATAVFVGIATIGIALGALFGYTELRTSTLRKTEDDLIRIIKELQKSGELADATSSVLLQNLVPDRVVIVQRQSGATAPEVDASNLPDNDVPTEESIAQQYPKEGENGDLGNTSTSA